MSGNERTDLENDMGVQAIEKGGLATVVKADMDSMFTKAEQELLASKALTLDDDPINQLFKEMGVQNTVLVPTYDPGLLQVLCQENNTLNQCVSAMEVNIDGTGYEIQRADGEEPSGGDETIIAGVDAFFKEPWPKSSFTTIRRLLRRDLESTGCAYMEVIRSLGGDIVFLKHLDAKLMRLVKLDDDVVVETEMERFGKKVTHKMVKRERRYIMAIGDKVRYFKEFGASRQLSSTKGVWESAGAQVPLVERANEVIEFKVFSDVRTPYGVPRWINQIPSVLGSRSAEELNLEFFRSGGLPPAIVLIQGGALSKDSKTSLTNYLAGKAKYKQRGVIVEVYSNSGDLQSSGQVKVSVERFGSERQQDSMFEKYDERCSMRVRTSFRLPPLFLGLNEDYNFATAHTAYMVAEAQVFKPERDEFDEIMNVTIMPVIAPGLVFRSKPISIKDVERQLAGLESAKDVVTDESWLDALNEVTSLTLVLDEDKINAANVAAALMNRAGAGAPAGAPDEPPAGSVKKDDGIDVAVNSDGAIEKVSDDFLIELAGDWSDYLDGSRNFEKSSIGAMHALLKAMAAPVRKVFDGYVGLRLARIGYDPDGVGELLHAAGCCVAERDMHGKS